MGCDLVTAGIEVVLRLQEAVASSFVPSQLQQYPILCHVLSENLPNAKL